MFFQGGNNINHIGVNLKIVSLDSHIGKKKIIQNFFMWKYK